MTAFNGCPPLVSFLPESAPEATAGREALFLTCLVKQRHLGQLFEISLAMGGSGKRGCCCMRKRTVIINKLEGFNQLLGLISAFLNCPRIWQAQAGEHKLGSPGFLQEEAAALCGSCVNVRNRKHLLRFLSHTCMLLLAWDAFLTYNSQHLSPHNHVSLMMRIHTHTCICIYLILKWYRDKFI